MSLAGLLGSACGGGESSAESCAVVPAGASTPAESAAGTATLSWCAPRSGDVAGYRVYYGTASGSYLQALGTGISTGNTTTYVVTGLPRGYRYYFAVTAVDVHGAESDFSNEASKYVQ